MAHQVSPLAPAAFPELPPVAGVKLAAAETGIRYKNRPDVLLAVMEPGTAVAGCVTKSKSRSAPVDWCVEGLTGGTARAVVVNSGNANAFGGTYLELVPNEKLRYTDVFEDPNLKGEIVVEVILKKVMGGTDVSITQAGIPDIIPEEMCYLGWQDSLRQLAQFVEIPSMPA